MVGEMATAVRLGLAVVFVVLVDRHLQLITCKQEHQGFPCFGTPSFLPPIHPRVIILACRSRRCARSLKCMTPWPRDCQTTGPVIIEALVDPSEYEHLILRRSELRGSGIKKPAPCGAACGGGLALHADGER